MTRFRAIVRLCLATSSAGLAAEWKPAPAPLTTPWTARVDPANPLPEHPRPDCRREQWLSLNGLWDYALEPTDFRPLQGFLKAESMTTGTPPATWDGKILVPFAIDSPLSGVMHVLRPSERLWYRRSFEVPAAWSGTRVLLHFEASDWETSAFVNGRHAGQHRGGYDPFGFDITDLLRPGSNTLDVCVWDGTEQNCQPLGKQIMPENRQGFRYQPTGGIWQSVWLEAVPETRILSLKTTASHTGEVTIEAPVGSSDPAQTKRRFAVTAVVRDGDREVTRTAVTAGHPLRLQIPNPKPWSPDSPHLYQLGLSLHEEQTGTLIDTVESYLGLRSIARRDDGRLLLNGQPAPLMFGPLDQGYWPDGILTPPHEDAIVADLAYLKSIGCNMVRVHIKTHPARWYWHADRLGLLVWQDMVCTPKYGQTVDPAASANWRREFSEIVADFHNHPSLVAWVVFNEAWGQHDTKPHCEWIAETDPSRLVIGASGWTDHGSGDILDVHNYSFYPSAPVSDGFGHHRALVFGELGGHNLLLPGHIWHPGQDQAAGPPLERAGGRMNFDSPADLAAKYPFYFRNLRHFASRLGYQGFVYTQLADIEHECNGWLTYDRKESKLPPATLRGIHATLGKPPAYTELLGNGGWQAGSVAAARGKDPAPPRWTAPAAAPAGFQTLRLPCRGTDFPPTRPNKPALGLRRSFTLDAAPPRAVLEVRATHREASRQAPAPRLDGHRARASQTVPFLTFLDGKFHRRAAANVETGQGEGAVFLELTDAELSALGPGTHTLAIELTRPENVASFQATLLAYHD